MWNIFVHQTSAPYCRMSIDSQRLNVLRCFLARDSSRPASRWGTEARPDLRLKWPQVDRPRLDHIRLDLTSLDNSTWLESTSNDFRSSEIMMNLRDTPFFKAQIDHFSRRIFNNGNMACIPFTVTLYRLTDCRLLQLRQVFHGDYCTDERMYFTS